LWRLPAPGRLRKLFSLADRQSNTVRSVAVCRKRFVADDPDLAHPIIVAPIA